MSKGSNGHGRRVARIAGEVFIIVVSILLAFGLDAWWQSQLQGREAAALLQALLTEFDAAEAELDRVANRHQSIASSADQVLAALRSPGSAAATVPTAALADLLATTTLDPQRGVLDALLASGDIGLVTDQQLRTLLADWPAALADYQEDDQAARSFVLAEFTSGLGQVVDLRPSFDHRLNTLGPMRGALSPEPEPELPVQADHVPLPKDLVVINLIENRRYLSMFALRSLDVLRSSFEEIRRKLRSEVTGGRDT